MALGKIFLMGRGRQDSGSGTILGSVSDYVVHHTHCPVCVVPPSAMKQDC